jgi:hypothetical protein
MIQGIDHYSYLIDKRHRPLLIGIVLLLLGVAETLTGQSLGGYGRTATRAENPSRFWTNVGICYAGGLFGILVFLYQNSN